MGRFAAFIPGILVCCIVVGCSSAPDAHDIPQLSQENDKIIHTIPLHAQLVELNSTLSKLADKDIEEEKSSSLLHQAAEEVWEALRIAFNDNSVGAPKPEMKEFRRKLKESGAKAGLFPLDINDMVATELANRIVDRIQQASQQALKIRDAAEQGLESAILDSISDNGYKMVETTRSTIEAEESITAILDSVMENMKRQPRFMEFVNSRDNSTDLRKGIQEAIFARTGRNLKETTSGKPQLKASDIADTLRERVADAIETLQSRFHGAIHTARDSFQEGMRDLEKRLKSMKLEMEIPNSSDKRRRLLQNVSGEFVGDDGDENNPFVEPAYLGEWTEEGILYWPPPVTETTIVVMLNPDQANETASFVEEALSILNGLLQNAVPLPTYPIEVLEEIAIGAPEAEEEMTQLGIDQNETYLPMRRLQEDARNGKAQYNQDSKTYLTEEWLWLDDGEDWLLSPQSNDEAITSLALSLLESSNKDVLPDSLIEMLADNSGAALLEKMASAPQGGTIHIEAVPRFAVFGSSVLSNGQLENKRFMTSPESQFNREKASEVIIMPLGTDIRAPMPHSVHDAPGSWDARWWGVGLAASAIGLLLAGTALAALKTSQRYMHPQVMDETFQAHINNKQFLQNTPLNAWEAKTSEQRKPIQNFAARKISNLPA